MRGYILAFLLFLVSAASNGNGAIELRAQHQYVDSLSRIIELPVHDTVKIDAINDFIFKYGNYSPAYFIPFSDIAIGKSRVLADSVRLSRSLNRKAVAYYYMDDYRMALNYYLSALQISEKVQIPENIASDYNNIGLVLLNQGIYRQALVYFKKALELLGKSKREDIIARVYDNLGMAHYSLGNYDSALVWYNKSFGINKRINQASTLASNIRNVGNILMTKGDFKAAHFHFKTASVHYDSIGNFRVLAETLNSLGYCKARLGRFDEAIKTLERSRLYIDALESNKLEIDNLLAYARVYELKGDKSRALQYMNEYIARRDSQQLTDKLNNYEQLRVIAETNEKIKDIELLRKVTQIQNEKLRNQRIIQIGSITLILLMLAVLLLVFSMLRAKMRNNRKLERLVEERTLELKLAKEQAEFSDFQKSEFLSNISHEVRTPMNAIVGFSDLLMHKEYASDEREEILLNIKQSTLKLLSLFEKISVLVQLENTTYNEPARKECNLENLFRTLELKTRERIAECKLDMKVKYTLEESLSRTSLHLPVRTIEATLNELIENAIKFLSSGELEFGVSLTDGKLKFYVSDNGPGIDSANLNRVFDKFVKFAPTHYGICDGAGIGLTIAKRSVENLGGTISIESKKGQGTRVEFTVPLC